MFSKVNMNAITQNLGVFVEYLCNTLLSSASLHSGGTSLFKLIFLLCNFIPCLLHGKLLKNSCKLLMVSKFNILKKYDVTLPFSMLSA